MLNLKDNEKIVYILFLKLKVKMEEKLVNIGAKVQHRTMLVASACNTPTTHRLAPVTPGYHPLGSRLVTEGNFPGRSAIPKLLRAKHV